MPPLPPSVPVRASPIQAPAPPADALLAWYDRSHRRLPWRDLVPLDAAEADAYPIWVSEVMLQQTTVAAVGPRYARFLARFPDVGALAAADWAELAEEWAGLGYYARARNLHAAAQRIAAQGWPRDSAGWRALPGVGPYTAAALGAIALGEAVVPVDGNVERVMSRLFAETAPLPGAKPSLARFAQGFAAQPAVQARPGDFAQALFDLGATICTPRRPACALCPWREACAGFAQGIQDALPRKAAKPAARAIFGTHFALTDPAGRLWLQRRPANGLLGGMLALPGTPWRDTPWEAAEALAHAPVPADWALRPGEARHGFTHRALTMRLMAARVPQLPPGESAPLAEAARVLPTAMRGLLALVG